MRSITPRVFPTEEGWVLKRGRRTGPAKPPVGVFPTRAKAVNAAREIVKASNSAEIIVYGRDGSVRFTEIHGWAPIYRSKVRSSLGTKAIRDAVNAVLREELAKK